MPRSSGTQTRTFNYTSGTTVGVLLLSASNPENGTVTYTYDAMMRLATMTDQSNYTQPVVNGVQYNAANQVTAMNYYGFAETRAYNNLMQLSNITATAPGQTGINVTYNYTPGSNNGKIASATDALSGETVTYQYDSLNRLISAAGSGWAQTQAYDGFGNLIGRTGTGTAQGTTISTPVNAATNQLSGYTYDANGNQISSGYGYDAENRIVSANAGGVEYLYDAQNKRVWQGNFSGGVLTTQSVTLFGADGKMLNTYGIAQAGTTVSFGGGALRAYFGGKLVGQLQTSGLMGAVVQDRLGSVGKYYPYGEERNAPPLANDQVKFATYTRDAATGNDYADQRYYSSALGRFMTVDASSIPHLQDPQSWNRYAYAGSDPVNHNDPSGRDWCGDYEELYGWFCFVESPGIAFSLNFDFSALAEQIAAQISNPETQMNLEIAPLYVGGYITGWTSGQSGSPYALDFQAGTIAIGADVCVAQPELCVIVVGATIYIYRDQIAAFANAVLSQITSREAAKKAGIVYTDYSVGRNDKGDCNDPDPKKFVKWKGSDDQHWHYIDWNVDKNCIAHPDFQTGPDPGSKWTEVFPR